MGATLLSRKNTTRQAQPVPQHQTPKPAGGLVPGGLPPVKPPTENGG